MGKGFRQGRLGEEMRKLISEMLIRDIKDPRLACMISISGVEVTSDGSYATCYVMPLIINKDPEAKKKEEDDVIAGLNSAKGLIKKEIGRQIKLRRIPDLIFKIDTSMEYGRHIDEVIDELGIKKDE